MRSLTLLILSFTLFSCNERIVQLPETYNAAITDILDVSPAYLFYDEERDSVEFNRKNLIGTTNWLVNIDKRLSLKQAMPHIMYLQNKRKKASMHKNEEARNYFSCSNPEIQNLAFIDFTETQYTDMGKCVFSEELKNAKLKTIYSKKNFNNTIAKGPDIGITLELFFDSDDYIYLADEKMNLLYLEVYINDNLSNNMLVDYFEIVPHFNHALTFQDYITFKSWLLRIENDEVHISKNELIYN